VAAVSTYLEQAARQLDLAAVCDPGSAEEAQRLTIAAKFERLAMIEQGLLPDDGDGQ
jgi:hypothetical protein